MNVADASFSATANDHVPGVTVVVPTLNRGGFLLNTLRDLLRQHHRPLEILVVDQSADTDPEVEALAMAYPEILRYHRVTFRGLPRARNFGWQHARYAYILYVDDDIRCGPDLASEHLRALTTPGVGLVAGGIDEANKPADIADRPGAWDGWSATPVGGFSATGEFAVDHGRGANFSVRREAIAQCGGVDEALSAGAALYEETDLALRIAARGYAVRFNGAARLQHLGAASGGCRTDEVADYVHGLAHNRAVLIRRHCRGLQRPVAFAHLASTAAAFAWHYRAPRCLPIALRRARAGWTAGGRAPACSAVTPLPDRTPA